MATSSTDSDSASPRTSPRSSSPIQAYESPPSSPKLPAEPQSSPFQDNEESDEEQLSTSDHASSSSSSCAPVLKKKRYQFCDPDPLHDAIYWPPVDVVNPANENIIHDVPDPHAFGDNDLDHHQQVLCNDAAPNEEQCVEVREVSDIDSSDESSVESSTSSDENNQEPDRECNESSSTDSDSSSENDDNDSKFGDLKLFEGCNLSVDEGVVTIMDLFLTHKLKKKTMESILQAMIKFMPESNNMPRSKHNLFQYVKKQCPTVPVTVHHYCMKCLYYIGLEEDTCRLCGCSSTHKFYQLDLAFQIRSLFENFNLAEIIDEYAAKRTSVEGHYSDICDGRAYIRVRVRGGRYNLVLLGHSDGVSISESSPAALWPLEFVICELPPHLRYKFVLMAGVWVDEVKPNMNCFLKPFVKELKTLYDEGVKWTNPKTNSVEVSHIGVCSFCCDAPVRAQIQNILSHGGRYCCNMCEQKMVKLPAEPVLPGEKKRKRKRVFLLQSEPSELRTAERMETQRKRTEAKEATGAKCLPVKGVKGRTVVSKLPKSDISCMVYPEYMHGIFGITKQFMSLWFSTNLPCNLKIHQDAINELLESVQVPDFVTRIPRSTQYISSWKANEIRTFLLYLSLIFLSKFMKAEYTQHWMLLVQSLYLLLQDSVSDIDISRAEILLRMFVRDFGKLYRFEDLTYNMHNLGNHYGLMARLVGPLWSNSAFQFESFNGVMKEIIHGTKNQGIELVNTLQIHRGVQIMKARCFVRQSAVKRLDVQLKSKINKRPQLSNDQNRLLAAYSLAIDNMYYRASIRGEVYTCNLYKRQIRRNNFTVCYLDSSNCKQYGEINFFCDCSSNTKMVFLNRFVIEHLRMFSHDVTGVVIKHIIPIKDSNAIDCVPIASILFKVIRVDEYVCIRPNRHEVNL